MRIFAIPLVIVLVTLVGLASALAGDGGYDALSWIGLGVPVSTILWAAVRRSA